MLCKWFEQYVNTTGTFTSRRKLAWKATFFSNLPVDVIIEGIVAAKSNQGT